MSLHTIPVSTARATAAVFATAALTLATAAPASAGPVERIPIDESETFLFDLCSIPTRVQLTETGTLTTMRRGRTARSTSGHTCAVRS